MAGSCDDGSIAITELMVRFSWVEPAEPTSFDLSTLTQQIISKIAETGGCNASVLHETLCVKGVFRAVNVDTFKELLRSLAGHDVIEQTSQGDLILGLVGERLRKDKGFYAAFQTSDGYDVRHAGEKIGTVDGAPLPEQHLILSGRRWQVTDVDSDEKIVYVVPAHGRSPAIFCGGGGNLHDEIVRMMRSVLSSHDEYGYLNAVANERLAAARAMADHAHICSDRTIALTSRNTAVMTWLGGRASATLAAAFTAMGLPAFYHPLNPIAIGIDRPIAECEKALEELKRSGALPSDTILCLADSQFAKYDCFLNDTLLEELRHRRWFDAEAFEKFLACGAGTNTRNPNT